MKQRPLDWPQVWHVTPVAIREPKTLPGPLSNEES